MGGSLDVGFTGELAKFSLRALRLPGGKKRNKHFRIPNNMHTRLDSSNCRKSCFSNFCVYALEINLHLCQKQ